MVQQVSNPCSLSTMTNITQAIIPQAHKHRFSTTNKRHEPPQPPHCRRIVSLCATITTHHVLANPTSTQHNRHTQFTRSSSACTIRCHTPLESLPANGHATTARIARQQKTRQTYSTSTRAQPCVQPTSHTATHKHPHNSSSQRTDSDTTNHFDTWGM